MFPSRLAGYFFVGFDQNSDLEFRNVRSMEPRLERLKRFVDEMRAGTSHRFGKPGRDDWSLCRRPHYQGNLLTSRYDCEKRSGSDLDHDNSRWEALRAIIVKQLGVQPRDVTKESNFVEDLGVD